MRYRRFIFRDVIDRIDIDNALSGTLLAKEQTKLVIVTEDGPYPFELEKGKALLLENVPVGRIQIESGKVLLTGYVHEPDATKPPKAVLTGEIVSIESAPTLENRLDEIITKFGLAPYPLTDSSAKFYGNWNRWDDLYSPTGFKWFSNDISTPASLEVVFYGGKFAIIFWKDTIQGIANIYVDGQLVDQVDNYDTESYWYTYFKDGLKDSKHILKIEVSGQKNPSSTDYFATIGGLFFPAGKNPFINIDKYIRDQISFVRLGGIIYPYYNILTSTPLSNGSSYVSGWEDRSNNGFSYILVLVYADTDTDVCIEQSNDRSTITHKTCTTVSANDNENNLIKAQLVDHYIRVNVSNNSGSDQTKLVVVKRYSMA